MEKITENIENRYEKFLELLKTNPEAIESQLMKNKYKEILRRSIENARSNPNWAYYVVPELLKLNIIEKSEIKERYKELLETAFEKAKSDILRSSDIIPELLKLNILEKSEIKEQYKELLETAIEKAKSDSDRVELVIPRLLKLNILEKSDKDQYKELLKIVFEETKSKPYWAKYILSELLKLNILDESDKDQYRDMLNIAFEKGKSYYYRSGYALPELLKLNILEKSEIKYQYKELLETAFEEAKSDSDWAYYAIPELLKLNILEKSEIKDQYKELLESAFERAIEEAANSHITFKWINFVVPELLKLNILEKSEIKEQYKELLEKTFEEAKSKPKLVRDIIPELLKIKILDESDKDQYKKLLKIAFEEVKFNYEWLNDIIPELLKLNILEKSEIKDQYKELLETAFEKRKSDSEWAKDVIPELLKIKILDESDKEQYKKLLKITFEEAKSDYYWAGNIVPKLLKLNILEKSEIKEQYKELLESAFEKGKTVLDWASAVSELLKLNILEKSEIKDQYKELLETAFEKAKSKYDKVEYVVLRLLKLNILEKNDKEIDMIKNISFVGGMSFLEKNKNKINEQDIEFIDKIDACFTKDEIDYLFKQDYEYFKEIETAVKEKDYQKIWEIKKESYSRDEKEKICELEKHFGKGIWTYFVDKVPGNKLLKNRFRDPHNALLHDIITFYYNYLDKNGVTKEDFLKNYLGVAGDRNNGYQQINNFLEKSKSKRKELVEGAMNVDEFKENAEFMSLAEGILEQEKTGELYKNLDNLEQILILLHMIRNKESLIKLQKLASSKDPKDKKLYEYYKGAIYHPRTKPIIMKMYEDPGKFLGLDDTTFRDLERIHQAKKPSNMVENFEFLDFDARDLVNCLPLGIYDQLSYFKPFEMKFYICGDEVYTKEELEQEKKEKIKNLSKNEISEFIKKLKKQGDPTMWYQMRSRDKEEFIEKLIGKYGENEVINMFIDLGYSEFNKYKNLREMTAKISPKSDPNNWFNGFNCDSLSEGHGKKVVAMFNPYCTDFCIYEGDQDPKEDNLKVTSWVTLNRAIPENFETLLNKVKSETTHDIANVLGDKFEDYKDPNEYVITMDNIEANPNFGSKNELAVRKMYEKFFSEYVRQNPMSPNGIPINTSKFYSGVNYNKLDILTDRVPNESLPVFVNAYSDNSKSYSLQGKLDAGEQKEKEKKTGIHPLSIEDVVQISYMEGKIYPASMKDHLGNLQHEITASILNNTLKGRPNLSFAWYNEEGKIGGYILAYQGKMKDGTPGIYISDFAMDEKERGPSGIKMIHHWMKVVKEKYPGMPVFTRARENTSYRMLKVYAKKQGYEITKDEIIEDCGEKFHRVVMDPKK